MEEKDLINHPYYIYGEGLFSRGNKTQPPRIPIDEPEGVDAPGATPTALPRSAGGDPNPGAVSLTEVEVLDLLSEGEIDSLVTAEYTYVGTLGNVGWDSVTTTNYNIPDGATVRWLRSIFWNEVPVVNSHDEYNFSDIQIQFTPGLPNGSTTSRVNTRLTYSRTIGERLRYGTDFAKTYRFLNKDIRAVQVNIKVGQLSTTSKEPATAGDVTATTVAYQFYTKPIYSTPSRNADFKLVPGDKIYGKISFGYIRTNEITLVTNTNNLSIDTDFLGWEIKIERTTPDSTDLATRNQTYIDSITEVYGDIFSYPNSAIVSSKFSAEFFSQVPNRAYDAKLLKILLPSNYDPIYKTYDETPVWDGTFAATKAWSDNPAWCYYDLVTNKRYGLGKYIDSTFVDKWTLYQIGKYCDTLVADGEGGLEPRFTCNLIINSRDDAYKVVNDMASIFRAMTYYGAGTIMAIQDSSKTPIYQFTNANVENGDFSYSSSSRRVRHTVGLVRYNDKKNFYLPAVEYVEDIDGIRKYGIREVELTAFGCTSRGQAIRYGKWALLSETLETESVSFTAGTNGAYLRPGDIIQIFDANRHTARYGGRSFEIASDGTYVILDTTITFGANTYNLSVLTPTYNYDPSQISDLDGGDFASIRRSNIQTRTFTGSDTSTVVGSDGISRTKITLGVVLNFTDYDVSGNPVWMAENTSNVNDPAYKQWDKFRVIRNEEQEDGVRYNISCIEYNDDKFEKLEDLSFEDTDYGATPLGPTDLVLSLEPITVNSVLIHYSFNVPNLENTVAFLVYVKKGSLTDGDVADATYLADRLPTSTTHGTYFPTSDGTYCFRVYAVNARGTRSTTYASPVNNCIDVIGIHPIRDITISSLRLSEDTATNPGGIRDTATSTDTDVNFNWQVGFLQTITVHGDFKFRVTFRQPSEGNPSRNIYFADNDYESADHQYELTFDENQADLVDSVNNINGPFRDFDVVVEVVDSDGNSSAGGNYIGDGDSDYSNSNGYDVLYVRNPRPDGYNLNVCDTNFCADAWISPEGEVKVQILDGTAPDDLAGGYIYTCVQDFTKEEAYGLISTTKTIRQFQITDSTNDILVANANYGNIDQAYVSISLYDSFDEALIDDGVTTIYKDLYFSPTKLILKEGKAAKNTVFSAWVDMVFTNWSNFDWTKNLNIASINAEIFANQAFVYNVVFKDAFQTNDYVVINTQSFGGNASERPDVAITQKRSDGFKFTFRNVGLGESNFILTNGMTVFLGVIYNRQE